MTASSAPMFGSFLPGFDFLQQLGQGAAAHSASAAMPGLPSWATAPMNVQEIDKRIEELKTVQFWLEQNCRAITAGIQALQVQKMTLATLQGMGQQFQQMVQAGMQAAGQHAGDGSVQGTGRGFPFDVDASGATGARAADTAAPAPAPGVNPFAQAFASTFASQRPGTDAASGVGEGASTAAASPPDASPLAQWPLHGAAPSISPVTPRTSSGNLGGDGPGAVPGAAAAAASASGAVQQEASPAGAAANLWWDALSQQFRQIANQVMRDPTEQAAALAQATQAAQLASAMTRAAVQTASTLVQPAAHPEATGPDAFEQTPDAPSGQATPAPRPRATRTRKAAASEASATGTKTSVLAQSTDGSDRK